MIVRSKAVFVFPLLIVSFGLVWLALILLAGKVFFTTDNKSFGENGAKGNLQYWAGRDTVCLFGRGRYQLLRGLKGTSGEILHDCETQNTILMPVQKWTKKGEYVYLVGSTNGPFVVLDIKTEQHEKFWMFEHIPEKLHKEFKTILPKNGTDLRMGNVHAHPID